METSARMSPFGVTIFTEITALAARHRAIDLGQGYPAWDGPAFVKEAAERSLREGGSDQYPPSPGITELREAISARYSPFFGRLLDMETEITVTSGCTEGLASAFLGLVDPGDEVILVEPFYDAYPVGVALAGAQARYIRLRAPDFTLDLDELRRAFNTRTRAIVVNTPHNPTGRVLEEWELSAIASLCREHDAIAICDEVYEEMVLEGAHLRLATFPGMAERTVTLSSIAKTYSLTGWKVGWSIAPPELTAGLRSAHQYLTFATPTPVQHGAVAALRAPDEFYTDLRERYMRRRDLLARGLDAVGFEVHVPAGTYFMMAGYDRLSPLGDREFVRHLIEEVGVAAVPPSAFYAEPGAGKGMVRFAFCKDEAVLEGAIERLQRLGR